MAVKRKSQAERLKALRAAIHDINKSKGETVIGTADDKDIKERLEIDYIPTASHRLNAATGGGWPRGRESIIKALF